LEVNRRWGRCRRLGRPVIDAGCAEVCWLWLFGCFAGMECGRKQKGDGWRGFTNGGGGPRRAGQSVRNHIRVAGSVTEIGSEFRQEREVPLLSAGPGRRDAGHGRHQRLVVRQNPEFAAFKEAAIMPHGGVCRQQLTIERGVTGLRRRQLLRKEG
jgi:hypothetical protein